MRGIGVTRMERLLGGEMRVLALEQLFVGIAHGLGLTAAQLHLEIDRLMTVVDR